MHKHHDFWVVILAIAGLVIFGLGLVLGARVGARVQAQVEEGRR